MKMKRRWMPLLLALTMLMPYCALAEDMPAKRRLTVVGHMFEPYIAPFEEENPDVQVVSLNWGEQSYQALVDNLVTNSKGFDLFALQTDYYDMNTLVDKGYVVALNHPELVEGARQMYAGIKDAILREDALYAWPMGLEMFGLGADTRLFEKLGLTLPRNVQELFDLVNTWEEQPEEVRETYIILSDVNNYRSALTIKLVDQYTQLYQYKQLPLTFDTPLFRKIMQGLDTLTEAMDFDWDDTVRLDFLDEALPLISVGHGMLSQGAYSSTQALQLVYEGEEQTFYPAILYLAILNASSDSQDLAQRFLAFIKDRTSAQTQTLLYDRPFEPVESPFYPDMRKQWEEQKTLLEKAITTSEPAGKQALEDELAQHVMAYEPTVEAYRYVLSEEDLAAFRETARLLFIPPPTAFAKEGDAFDTHLFPLMQRYAAHNINSEQFIAEAEALIRLIISENE
ncbi:MAG: carbohydrate ABC transporter substrate-binding protein [Clostridiales bacterium]|nr:carbohydrate ABC transporter substrate-binding protein [Clostridiales bacterium]